MKHQRNQILLLKKASCCPRTEQWKKALSVMPAVRAHARLYNWGTARHNQVTRKRTHPVFEAKRILFNRDRRRAISAGTTSAIMKFLAR